MHRLLLLMFSFNEQLHMPMQFYYYFLATEHQNITNIKMY